MKGMMVTGDNKPRNTANIEIMKMPSAEEETRSQEKWKNLATLEA